MKVIIAVFLMTVNQILKKNVENIIDFFSSSFLVNKAGYTATPVACGWAGAVFEVT